MGLTGSIPFFPPWCVTMPVEEKCTALGITMSCVALPTNDEVFAQHIAIGHWLTLFALIGIGIINLLFCGRHPSFDTDKMKIITSFYAIGTGFFSWFRLYFGVGQFLLMTAAVHNLGEWSILMMIAADNDTENKLNKRIMYLSSTPLVLSYSLR